MAERRKHPRRSKYQVENLKVTCQDGSGAKQAVLCRVVDCSEGGLGIAARARLAVGGVVSVSGEVRSEQSRVPTQGRARVAYCMVREGLFRIGLSFEALGYRNPFFKKEAREESASHSNEAGDSFIDFYEVLQLSPNAHADMIHRAYRLLAQRYHPDNRETGNEETFKLLLKAQRILSDPEQRAAYDIEHRAIRKMRWKIFDQPKAAQGMDAEKRKRYGILSLLYHKRIRQPEQPNMNLIELGELLGCPREHLEFGLWYLRENACIGRADNGRYFITAKGVEMLEASKSGPSADRLLTMGAASSPGCKGRSWEQPAKQAVAV